MKNRKVILICVLTLIAGFINFSVAQSRLQSFLNKKIGEVENVMALNYDPSGKSRAIKQVVKIVIKNDSEAVTQMLQAFESEKENAIAVVKKREFDIDKGYMVFRHEERKITFLYTIFDEGNAELSYLNEIIKKSTEGGKQNTQ